MIFHILLVSIFSLTIFHDAIDRFFFLCRRRKKNFYAFASQLHNCENTCRRNYVDVICRNNYEENRLSCYEFDFGYSSEKLELDEYVSQVNKVIFKDLFLSIYCPIFQQEKSTSIEFFWFHRHLHPLIFSLFENMKTNKNKNYLFWQKMFLLRKLA